MEYPDIDKTDLKILRAITKSATLKQNDYDAVNDLLIITDDELANILYEDSNKKLSPEERRDLYKRINKLSATPAYITFSSECSIDGAKEFKLDTKLLWAESTIHKNGNDEIIEAEYRIYRIYTLKFIADKMLNFI